MSKKVLIISSSLRGDSNSDILADRFKQGARNSGHSVEKINIRGRTINFCRGCLSCQHTQQCIIRDDMACIIEKIKISDVIVFATPIYFYSMCGQLKTLLDRTNPLFAADYKFTDIYLIATAADAELSAVDGTATALKGWISCFDNARLAGVVSGLSIVGAGDAHCCELALNQSYVMGSGV